jgi:hypothetical protein
MSLNVTVIFYYFDRFFLRPFRFYFICCLFAEPDKKQYFSFLEINISKKCRIL